MVSLSKTTSAFNEREEDLDSVQPGGSKTATVDPRESRRRTNHKTRREKKILISAPPLPCPLAVIFVTMFRACATCLTARSLKFLWLVKKKKKIKWKKRLILWSESSQWPSRWEVVGKAVRERRDRRRGGQLVVQEVGKSDRKKRRRRGGLTKRSYVK